MKQSILIFLALVALCAHSPAAEPKPNIVFILADDLSNGVGVSPQSANVEWGGGQPSKCKLTIGKARVECSASRPMRIEFAGAIYHVSSRRIGSWRDRWERLFRDDEYCCWVWEPGRL